MKPDVAAANRWTQLTFTEDDPASFDLDRWVDIRTSRQHRDAVVTLLISGQQPVVEHDDDGHPVRDSPGRSAGDGTYRLGSRVIIADIGGGRPWRSPAMRP
jgi:hypothetical protein